MVCLRCISTWTSRIDSLIPHVTGANVDDGKKDRRRKEIVGRLGKEMNDRRDECVLPLLPPYPTRVQTRWHPCPPSGRQYTESISALHSVAMQLAARPETLPSYTLRLYPLSLERSALLAQLAVEERNSLECAEAAYELERERVEEEWKRGRDRIRERLLEGIEERRRRARDEKDGEGTVSGALDVFFLSYSLFVVRGNAILKYFEFRGCARFPITPTHHTQTSQQTRHITSSHASRSTT